MVKSLTKTQRAYLAGFLDGDGSVYVQLKTNKTYKYGFQVAPYIVFYQSGKSRKNFEKICRLIPFGYIRIRKDGIWEYIIGTQEGIRKFIEMVENYTVMKKSQIILLKKIITAKRKVKNQKDFNALVKLIDSFRKLNYSKKRKIRMLTP